MTHGLQEVWSEGSKSPNLKYEKRSVKTREGKAMGSRRIFSPQFKLQVLDSYRCDSDCRGNQRATARKYGIHRRQIQKWLQMESSLRRSAEGTALNLGRQHGGTCNAGSLPPAPDPSPSPPSPPHSQDPQDEFINVDKISDSEDELSSGESTYEQDQALDFTCAALSRRRFFTNSFKTEVIEAFYSDPVVRGNQRATARKFGIHRRQVQKWLDREAIIRGEPCLDLSKKRSAEEAVPVSPKWAAVATSPSPSCSPCQLPTPSPACSPCLAGHPEPRAPPCCLEHPYPWGSFYYSYVSSYLSPWAQDAHYYKNTVQSMHLYTPLYS